MILSCERAIYPYNVLLTQTQEESVMLSIPFVFRDITKAHFYSLQRYSLLPVCSRNMFLIFRKTPIPDLVKVT
jgi:hypothetical protein